MKIIQTPVTMTFFGSSTLSLNPKDFRNKLRSQVMDQYPFDRFKEIEALVLLNQTHSNTGFVIKNIEQAQTLPLFTRDGDFLTTNLKNVGLGVVTADCLPIIAIDSTRSAIGIAHAGWRGSATNIASTLIKTMIQEYGSDPSNLIIQLGPCASECCYEVQPSFIENLKDTGAYPALIGTLAEKTHRINDHGDFYFNLPEFNRHLLIAAGVNSKNIDLQAQECTICMQEYISIRRKETTLRQLTVVSLK